MPDRDMALACSNARRAAWASRASHNALCVRYLRSGFFTLAREEADLAWADELEWWSLISEGRAYEA